MADRFSRRDVLAMGAGVLAFSPVVALADLRIKKPVKFGLITDVHHGLAPDALQRLRVFIDEARTRDLDFVIQVGDFNHPTAEARAFLDVWSDYRGPRYGVLGNHDMDMGTKEDAIQFWSIPSRYYAFDSGELHCVVLDANNIYENGRYEPYANANFYRSGSVISHIDDEQFDWFAHEVFTTNKQTIV
ncbi:MAG TPA: metallophosphoesterase, partial [Fimbriimonadaceae bacterium]|nr:metallophosphoesterase [Fimbriimonadaceae bacterium]